jgi:hypothetical protein
MSYIGQFVSGRLAAGKRLFHFTDARNIQNIKRCGLLSTRELRKLRIPVVTGGDNTSLSIDQRKGFDAFVRLSFCPSHPMSHVAVERKTIENVRVLSVCPTVLLRPGVLLSDRVATANDARIGEAENMIGTFDLEAAYSFLDWNVAENHARRSAVEKWEVLVPSLIATDLIRGL